VAASKVLGVASDASDAGADETTSGPAAPVAEHVAGVDCLALINAVAAPATTPTTTTDVRAVLRETVMGTSCGQLLVSQQL
jgi:hypothetical protein